MDIPLAATGDPAALRRLQADLLAWFDVQQRDLPWRRRRSLYGTWISEMMLQQTTVATVVPYWERFLARFPDVAALAAAPEPEVLALWSGLGYYRRARQLHSAAREVVAAGSGLPASVDGWRRLPGIGPYAAGAIASLGLGLPEPAVDANVRRVLARWLGRPGAQAAPTTSEFAAAARTFLPAASPGPWNEALMELGALVCLPRQPACDACPVAAHCGAAGRVHELAMAPAPRRQPALPVGLHLVAFLSGPLLWLEPAGCPPVPGGGPGTPARDDFATLHPGLLTLPMTAWYRLPDGGARQACPPEDWAGAVLAGLPDGAAVIPGAYFRHAITRYRLSAGIIRCELPAGAGAGNRPAPGRAAGQWVPVAAADRLAVSQLARKALRFIG